MTVHIKRVYHYEKEDGTYRILADRLWPRGIKKTELEFDEWNKEITPSPELRKWFDHKPDRFTEFSRLYTEELSSKGGELARLRKIARKTPITLLYGAKDPQINHAVVLQAILLGKS